MKLDETKQSLAWHYFSQPVWSLWRHLLPPLFLIYCSFWGKLSRTKSLNLKAPMIFMLLSLFHFLVIILHVSSFVCSKSWTAIFKSLIFFLVNLFALKGNAFYFTFGFNCVLEWNVIPYYQTIKVSSFPLLNIFLSLEECSGCQSSILDYGNCTASFRSMERSVSLADIYKSTCTRQIVSSS